MSHTQGPWVWGSWTILDEDRESQRQGKPYWTLVADGGTGGVLTQGPLGRKAMQPESIIDAEGYETEGICCRSPDDAALIAAAPYMLRALELVLSAEWHGEPPTSDILTFDKLWRVRAYVVHEAIAMAKAP